LTLYLFNPLSLWIMRRRMAKGLPLMKAGATGFGGFLSMLAVPTLYTMVLAGIWHGAGFKFLLYGLLHGIYLCVNHAWRFYGPKTPAPPPNRLAAWADGAWKWALTYLSVAVSLTFFRAKTTTDAWNLVQALFGGGTGDSPGGATGTVESILDYFGVPVPYWNYSNALITVGLVLVFALTLPNVLQLFEKEGASLTKTRSAPALFNFKWRPNWVWGFLLGALALVDVLMVTGNSEFLYFKF
jgi:alginate O-acetyltransferase complex protein AlgI